MIIQVETEMEDISLSSLKPAEFPVEESMLLSSDDVDHVDSVDPVSHCEPVSTDKVISLVGVRHSPSCAIITFEFSARQAFLYVNPFTPHTNLSHASHNTLSLDIFSPLASLSFQE